MSSRFKYPELNKLNEFYLANKFTSKIHRSELLADLSYYPKVNFTLKDEHFYLFVDDEYDDLKTNYPLLVLCLVLRELEGYEYTNDYKIWCHERYLNPEDSEIKECFQHLKKVYIQVKKMVKEINSYVTDFDFEMNSGAAQELRKRH